MVNQLIFMTTKNYEVSFILYNNIFMFNKNINILNNTFYLMQKEAYNTLLITIIIAMVICFVLTLIPYIFSLTIVKEQQKLSEYECGFEPFDNSTRLPFDIHFYIVGILFLIFDVEISLIFP